MAVISAFLCITLLTEKLVKLIRLGLPKELSQPGGSVKDGIIYSFTGAMSPKSKESAYLHLPTYLAGIAYHMGTFASLLIFPFILFFSDKAELIPVFIIYAFSGMLALSALAGTGILVKRVFSSKLKYFSSADDFISNILTTALQAATSLLLIGVLSAEVYYLSATLIFLWMPFGKTKHLLYFFFARIHLGYFYGRRGTWPVTDREQ